MRGRNGFISRVSCLPKCFQGKGKPPWEHANDIRFPPSVCPALLATFLKLILKIAQRTNGCSHLQTKKGVSGKAGWIRDMEARLKAGSLTFTISGPKTLGWAQTVNQAIIKLGAYSRPSMEFGRQGSLLWLQASSEGPRRRAWPAGAWERLKVQKVWSLHVLAWQRVGAAFPSQNQMCCAGLSVRSSDCFREEVDGWESQLRRETVLAAGTPDIIGGGVLKLKANKPRVGSLGNWPSWHQMCHC